MTRKTHCKVCKKEVDEGTRQSSIQEFGVVVCSMKCAVDWFDIQAISE
jgi:hypothetical protein